MALIDEEARFPKGTDHTMLAKLQKTHGTHKNYLKPKSDINTSFGLNHFAGVVFYDTSGFLDKNRDMFSPDLLHLVSQSSNKFLRQIFNQDIEMGAETRKRTPTLSTQFKKSLDALMKTLSSCQPFFIRCIKPNEVKRPMLFDRGLCCRQLRYSGMMETIRIRRASYPIRHGFRDFVERYRFLIPGVPPAHRTDCRLATSRICAAVLGISDYQLGHTKVFLKDAHDLFLEQERDRVLTRKILILQRTIRGWVYRRRFLRMRVAAVTVQRYWKGYAQRKRYHQMRVGYMRLQALIRSRVLSHRFRHLRGHIVGLQAHARGYLVRREYGHKMWAIIKIQSHVRRMIAMCNYKKLKEEYKKFAEVLHMRKMEEQELMYKGNKHAREMAEQHYRDCLHELERREMEQEIDERRRIEVKKNIINDAARKQDEPVDDGKLVEAMFDFLPDSSSEAPTPHGGRETSVFSDLPHGNNVNQEDIISEDEEDLSEFKFQKFAATYFQGNVNHQYSKKALKHLLLPLHTQGDQLAAQALWITILRFTGDMPEPKYHTMDRMDTTFVMSKVTATLGRNFIRSKEFQEAQLMGLDPEAFLKQKLKRKYKLGEDVRRRLQDEEYTADSYQSWLQARPTSNLEKLHFIIGYGILRAELRDEIYCQICKQLTNNPSFFF